MVQYIICEGSLICTFSGKLDTAGCSEIGDELIRKVQEAKMPVVFDMKNVDYVASAFLRLCLLIVREVDVDKFSIIKVSPNVKKVFKIAGLDRQMRIE